MSVEFSPLIPLLYIGLLAAAAAVLSVFSAWQRVRGALFRVAALAALCLALLNPVVLQTEREPLDSVVAVVVDRSQSQASAERTAMTDAALEQLQTQLAGFTRMDVRVVEVGNDTFTETPSTRLFEALSSALEDVPTSRIAGAVMITDGQVHDVPSSASELGFNAPVHGLITGAPGEIDRRIELVDAPRFGIVGEPQEISYRVSEEGAETRGVTDVTVRVNGEIYSTELAPVGQTMPLFIEIDRAGDNIIELEVGSLPGEVSLTNNRAVAVLEGIRENLRVLLVSGEPHAGERAWRNLLKSDTSVDLVHFTILRPPEKQDGTPIDELSLIAFPTRELFVEKINEFDLIVFDRYQRRGVLPVLYYDYITQYVEAGGALLIAAGPEHAGRDSIATTPLAPVLPATPTGEISEVGFYPRLSDAGRRHPVTRELPGSGEEPPQWGRWFRAIAVDAPQDDTILEGPDGAPLLILNRVGDGRVAMLMSDHGWLWARGFEGGGPHVPLYRRIAHWLMKEPSLEEESLRATSRGNLLTITRQTMSEEVPDAVITTPTGETLTVPLIESADGLFEAELPVEENGLFDIANADMRALVHVGAVNAPEFAATVSTTEILRPLVEETGGIARRVSAGGTELSMPTVLPVKGSVRPSPDRLVLKITDETELKGVNRLPLFAGFFGLALLFLTLGSTWYREGR
ncbi:hypothetical protein [Hoeflea prorocentri]|uniref:Glutamine amidotransferase domain-containing protein n=1 Tax=Hoeflea prorocentri TaxID=1922333 RepID=A0A9X3UF83_9HYPH|nr:hypothetical protein [Hoeflea prorocentri]MCY6379524.1 hypothetical protein [Hoeflea prorocentri]MDA5397324.1 hypothetical protein [Hoeflea prorocentri]